MHDDSTRLARRDALAHAQGVFGAAQERADAGLGLEKRTELLMVRQMIAARGVPGAPMSAEHTAGSAERAAILKDIDDALSGAGGATGFDILTVAERMIQARLKAILF